MKKIFAILCGATMMFAACTPNEGEGVVTPVFPEETTAEVLAGASYTLTFDANVAWTVSLENDLYAQLSYNNGEGTVFDTEVSGAEGEGIVVKVVVNDLKNYDADVVIPVTITMGGETKTLATLTVKKIERPESIVQDEFFETVTFEKNGHPTWGGEFLSAPEKYHLNYADKWDIEGVGLVCNLENVSYKAYAYNENGNIVEASWVSVVTYGGEEKNGFKVVMDLTNPESEYSWNENDEQYEAYVNIVDGEENVLVSLYCTCTYNPNAASAAKVALVNPEMAAMADMVLEGSGNNYTLTLNSPMSLSDSMAPYCGFTIANARQAFFQNEGWGLLSLVQYDGYYHVQAMADPTAAEYREYPIQAYTYDWQTINITVVLAWVEEVVTPLDFYNPYYAPMMMTLTGSDEEGWTLAVNDYNALYAWYAEYVAFTVDGATSVAISGQDETFELVSYDMDDKTYYTISCKESYEEEWNPTTVVNKEFTLTATMADGTEKTVTVYLAFVDSFGEGGIGGMEPWKLKK